MIFSCIYYISISFFGPVLEGLRWRFGTNTPRNYAGLRLSTPRERCFLLANLGAFDSIALLLPGYEAGPYEDFDYSLAVSIYMTQLDESSFEALHSLI